MHIINSPWMDLAAGYQLVQSLQCKLESEFGRAVQAGHKQKFRKVLTEWQKKRRIFFALVALAPLSVITLCVAAYYLRDVACVIIYWAVLVLVILVTLAVAGRDYIRQAINRPEPKPSEGLSVDLEQRWWASLSPKETAIQKADGKAVPDLMALFGGSLPDTYLAGHGLVLGESGIWLFVTRDWSGKIVRQADAWKHGQTGHGETAPGPAPDDEWQRRKEALVKVIQEQLPQYAWTANLVQGGVAFTHPKARLDKAHIRGNTAAYGPAKAWVERLRRAAGADGFSLPIQLGLLDALSSQAGQVGTASAKDEAERLYQQAASELRESVAKMVT